MSTMMNSTQLMPFVNIVTTYEEGFAILQYCRLIHKTCEKFPSMILSQWLLNVCQKLQEIKLDKLNEKNEKLLEVIKDYNRKYQK